MSIVVNTRILSGQTTGAPRYLDELLRRWADHVDKISPTHNLHGLRGHAWEQFVLPTRIAGRVLFSPSNTGPLAVRRQVVALHDVVPLDHPEWLNPRFAAWYRFLTPRLAKRVAHIVTVSHFSKERIIERIGIDEDRITVAWNGVDKRFQPRSKGVLTDSLSKLKLPSDRYVLYVGSLEPRKNVPRLLDAWRGVLNEIQEDIWLILAGAKGKPDVFASDDAEKNLPARVHLAGHVDDKLLPYLYSGALCFVYPSIYEGFGLPPVEAMSSGVPVVTSNRAALSEIAGDAAILVDPFKVDDIADGIVRICNDSSLRQRLIRSGLERANLFNWDMTASSILDAIRMI